MRRINVIGSSGAGKTTLARRLARRLGLPHLELDAIHHLPGWTPRAREELRAEVAEFVARPAWVIDGNYSSVRDLLWARADTVVFLDFPRWKVMSQLIPRTVRRFVTRQELWNGNREPLRNFLSLDPERSIIAWSWTRHAKHRRRFDAALDDPQWSHVRFVRLPSRRAVDAFVERL